MHRTLRVLIFGLLILAGIKGAYHLFSQAYYFLGGAYAGDAKYYWTVGRAILNGFSLYTETFDTKPPGIYLLSALSMLLTKGLTLGNVINGLMTLALPAAFAAASWKVTGKRLQTGIGVLFGTVLTLYMGFQAQAWQVEWYGGFFGLLYVCLLAAHPNGTSKQITVMLALCMAGAIGFKEPFLLSLIAAALILLPDRKLMTKQFLVPVTLTAVIGVVLMMVFGYLGGYIDTYLPSQFGHHIARSIPLPLRGIQVGVLGFYLASFSYVLPVLIAVLVAAVFTILWSSNRMYAAIASVTALYLVILAGNLRGYPAANHFVVAVPYYGALFFVWLKHAKGFSAIGVPLLTALTVLLLPMSDGFTTYAKTLEDLDRQRRINRNDAMKIDAILDACDVERYFFVEERPYMEHMKHSPLNFFVYVGPEAIVYHSPLLIEKQLDSFSGAKIVIAEGDAYELRERPEENVLTQMTFRYLANHFTVTPWECAASLPVPERYSVLYRKNPENMQPFPYKMQ